MSAYSAPNIRQKLHTGILSCIIADCDSLDIFTKHSSLTIISRQYYSFLYSYFSHREIAFPMRSTMYSLTPRQSFCHMIHFFFMYETFCTFKHLRFSKVVAFGMESILACDCFHFPRLTFSSGAKCMLSLTCSSLPPLALLFHFSHPLPCFSNMT